MAITAYACDIEVCTDDANKCLHNEHASNTLKEHARHGQATPGRVSPALRSKTVKIDDGMTFGV